MSESIKKSKIDTHKEQQSQSKLSSKQRFKHLDLDSKNELQGLFNDLSALEQRQLLENLKLSYSLILFDCLSSENNINQKIESFAKEAFSISLPLEKVVEIHKNLIDTLESQLQFEGLRFEYLGYFRLTLINIIIRLGKMYSNAIVASKPLDTGYLSCII